jgi:hypothetical protein
MTDFFHIMSLLPVPGNALVMDVDQDPTTDKTAIGVFPRKQPPDDANQLWFFEPGTEVGFVFIHNKLNPNLVVDALGNTGKEGELLALFPKNGGPNQQWSFQPLIGGPLAGPATPGFIQSLMGNKLVMDVPHFDSKNQLQVFGQKQNDATNQLWMLVPAQTEGSNATVQVPNPVIGAPSSQVELTGTGFEPGTGVLGNYEFQGIDGSPLPGSAGDFNALTDLTGVWHSAIPVELAPGGALIVHLDFSFPLLGPVAFDWDGSRFTRDPNTP